MPRVHKSEKQMHKEHKLITQKEKARCQVLLEISKLQGNLLHPEIQRLQGNLSWKQKLETIVRQIYGRSPTDDLIDLDVNKAIWVYS